MAIQKTLAALSKIPNLQALTQIQRGIEKECLRIDAAGMIAGTPHPKALGSSLMHPHITTDFSEALLEFITSPVNTVDALFQQLEDIHRYTYEILNNELLWSLSMPCRLPADDKIPIAQYGSSYIGKIKEIYRKGLGLRYGRAMQTIAGIHYNFSFSDHFWKSWQQYRHNTDPLPTFVSDQYFHMIRNGLRYGWFLVWYFGASPAVCQCFLKDKKMAETAGVSFQELKNTYIAPYATSLRLSDLGYHNKYQTAAPLSYNSLQDFLTSMTKAVTTPVSEYTNLGVKVGNDYHQLNDTVLQIENEHYGMIRPKHPVAKGERLLKVLGQQGVSYLEVRAIDINPFMPLGIDKTSVALLDLFLIFCLLLESPPLNAEEKAVIRVRHQLMTQQGRQPNFEFSGFNLKENLNSLLTELTPLAEFMDTVEGNPTDGGGSYQLAIDALKATIEDPNRLPSARAVQAMTAPHSETPSYFEFGMHWSKAHREYFLSTPLTPEKKAQFESWALKSLEDQRILEEREAKALVANPEATFEKYLKQYMES